MIFFDALNKQFLGDIGLKKKKHHISLIGMIALINHDSRVRVKCGVVIIYPDIMDMGARPIIYHGIIYPNMDIRYGIIYDYFTQ